MKDFFIKVKEKNFLSVFLIGLASAITILAIVLVVVWYNRNAIFGYFTGEYFKNGETFFVGNTKNLNGITGNSNIFSQEYFVEKAAKDANPAVVSIVLTKDVPKYVLAPNQNSQNNPLGNIFPNLPNFYFSTPQYVQNGTQKEEIGSGSGFFVSSDGLIVTNKHVVDQQGVQYTVLTNDGKEHPATVVALDPLLDIALLKISPSSEPTLPTVPTGTENTKPPYAIGTNGYPYLSLGDSDQLQVGQSVIAIGNALGQFSNTVSLGVISGLSRSITAGDALSGSSETLNQVIQTDAAINPGNSGGPLLDLSGKVIGVNVALAQGSQNVGFALPINSVRGAIDSVEKTGKIIRAFLGIRYIPITSQIQQEENLSVDYGALIKSGINSSQSAVVPGSPADKAGIIDNDIILDVDGQKIDSDHPLASIINLKSVGQTITLTILRNGVQKIIKVTLEEATPTTIKG